MEKNKLENLQQTLNGISQLSDISIFSDSMKHELCLLQKQIVESENLSMAEFENKLQCEKSIYEILGRHGWVISNYENPKTAQEWYSHVGKQDLDSFVMQYFEENDGWLLRNIIKDLRDIYIYEPHIKYYSNGVAAFDKRDYMTAAMYLCPLFERRTNLLIKPDGRTNEKKYSNKGYRRKKEKVYDDHDFFVRRFIAVDMYASLIAFTRRLFVDGKYNWSKNGPEPPYLNRNWLLHGYAARKVTKCDCVQLLNAIRVLEFVGAMDNR